MELFAAVSELARPESYLGNVGGFVTEERRVGNGGGEREEERD